MRRAVERCAAGGAEVGAHPGYVDRGGFGRVKVEMGVEEVREMVRGQCAALARIAGVPVRWVKAHGALYHVADTEAEVAESVVAALGSDVTLIGPPGGCLAAAAARAGVRYAREGFADRGVGADGRLLPRGVEGAVIEDPGRAAAVARALMSGGMVDTVCVHGDNPNAVAVARAVRAVVDG